MLTMRMELKGSGIHVSLIEPGPVASKIAPNALPWFERYIDHEDSVHREAYQGAARAHARRRLEVPPEAGARCRACGFAPRPAFSKARGRIMW